MKKRIIYNLFAVLSVLLLFTNSCKKDDSNNNSSNPKNNNIVKNALLQAGIITYDGNTPPTLEGIYSTTPMLIDAGTGNLKYFIGSYLNSTFKLYNQTPSGEIAFSEKTPNGLWNEASGCYITGSDNNFTLWMNNTSSTGATTVFVLSGTIETTTGNFVNCKSETVYTSATSSYNVGDYYASSGYILNLSTPVGKWTKSWIAPFGNDHMVRHMELYSDGNFTIFDDDLDGGTDCNLSGRWSTSGNLMTITNNASECMPTELIRTGPFTISNDGNTLTLPDLYVYQGTYTRE